MPRKSLIRDDLAYMLPMGVFLLLIAAGGYLGTETPAGNTAYPWAYAARALIVAALLIFLWPAYTRIRWNGWWLGLIVGVIGIFQWVGMQLFLQQFEFFKPKGISFNPDEFFTTPSAWWAFVAIRIFGAVLVVPVMEELFWRDFTWRTIIAPNDFKLASVGEWDWKAFLLVPLAFSLVHDGWWATSIVWALMIGGLLAYTRSIGACIIAHATTNLLLALYVLKTRQWFFW